MSERGDNRVSDADWSTRRKAPRRRNRGRNNGRGYSNRTDRRPHRRKIRSHQKRIGWGESPRRRSFRRATKANRAQSRDFTMAKEMSNSDVEKQRQAAITQAALNAPIPRLYANAHGVLQSSTDLSVVLVTNNQPVAILSLSYSTAKALAGDIDRAVKAFEKAARIEIKSVEEMNKKMQELMTKEGAARLG